MTHSPRIRPALAGLAAGALLLAACSSPGSPSASVTSLTGTLTISGSSTVEPITSIVAEDFKAANPDVSYSVDGPGIGDGFALFCDGETDISDASREIKDEEATLCADNGINFVGLKVGIDGLSVMTSPAWGWRSSATSPRPTAERLASRAARGSGPRSGSTFRARWRGRATTSVIWLLRQS